nr:MULTISPECIES: hypothetical protein [unclassified Bradyrhizobium]
MFDARNELRPAVRLGHDAVSAVKLSQQLTAKIDAWAETQEITRADGIRRLLEIGLQASAPAASPRKSVCDSIALEQIVAQQLERMLAPDLPADERERRIRRLIEGPPEFSKDRLDRPKYSR